MISRKQTAKTLTRHIWQDYMERAEGVWHSPFGKKTMRCARRPLSAPLPVQKKKRHALYAISSFACGYPPGEAQICREESEKAHNPQAYMENRGMDGQRACRRFPRSISKARRAARFPFTGTVKSNAQIEQRHL